MNLLENRKFLTFSICTVFVLLVIYFSNGRSLNFKFSTEPSITIISPKSGTVFKSGDQIKIKWKVKNMPAGYRVQAGITYGDGHETSGGYDNLSDFSTVVTAPTFVGCGKYSVCTPAEPYNPFRIIADAVITTQDIREADGKGIMIIHSNPVSVIIKN